MTTPDADRARAVKIATVALHRAQAGDLQDAASYVRRLTGTPGLIVAIIAWIDTYIARIHPGHQPGQQIALRWFHTPTDRIETADQVTPAMRWAGWLIVARAADQEERFYELLQTPAEGTELGDGIMALLHLVAHSVSNPDLVHAAAERLTAGSAT
jgi:hypothetical protein